jgi:hypothetical protein
MTIQPMLFSQTYEIITEESAEQGDAEERGYDWQDSEESFTDLVRRLRTDYYCAEPSDSHGNPRWVTSYGEMDMYDGSYRNISLHPENDRAKRWFPKALRAAGILR